MPKITVQKKNKQRHNPLHVELTNVDGILRQTPKHKSQSSKNDDEDTVGAVDASTSRAILTLAREQQQELEAEEEQKELDNLQGPQFQLQPSDDEDYEDIDEDEEFGEAEEVEALNPEDQALIDKYLNNTQSFNLADKILGKLATEEDYGSDETEDHQDQPGYFLPPKVIEVYEQVGLLLSRYKSGRLPKAFKIIPTLRNWPDVLYVTNVEQWSPVAVFEATSLFVSNLSAAQATKFVNIILLPRFKAEFERTDEYSKEPRKLNYHIYRALKKSLYKPSAFFKGFLFPICEEGCSLKEAIIVSSVLSKISIPALHSAAAIMRLTEMKYSVDKTMFIKALLDKKYALPYKVIDSLVFYFMSFRNTPGNKYTNAEYDNRVTQSPLEENTKDIKLPVVWHQAFLSFATIYKNDITDDQRDFLLEVVRMRGHHMISPKIREQLLAGVPRMENGIDTGEQEMVDAF